MSEEFNIFKNLEDLKNANLLDQLKYMESANAEGLNNSQKLDDSFDFDSFVCSNKIKKTPTKRQRQKEQITTPKKLEKNAGSRRASISTDGSISPTMPLLENLTNKADDNPVGRRTRSSTKACKNVSAPETMLENMKLSTSKSRAVRNKGGRGRGRGRRSGQTSATLSGNAFGLQNLNFSNSSESTTLLSSNEAPTLSLNDRFLQTDRRGRSRVMRARRQYLAEIAARSTQVDSIDLVSSPMPRVEGFINLDSDTEEATPSNKNINENISIKSKKINSSTNDISLDISYDDDNPELNIKVNWKGKLETFKLRKHQKFSAIFKELAEREHIGMESIVFNLNNRIIMADDTPDSINYKIFHFIEGRVLSSVFNTPGSVAAGYKKHDANNITLKVQSDKWKRPLQISIMKTDKFRVLYIKCAEELEVDLDHLKLSFDGELLELNDTPMDLDLEGGEAIDIHLK